VGWARALESICPDRQDGNNSIRAPGEAGCAVPKAIPNEGWKPAAATCKPLGIMALLPEIAGKLVDRYGNVIRHPCHNRPQWNRLKRGSNCVPLSHSAFYLQDDGQNTSR
jgi:hypothetical protein